MARVAMITTGYPHRGDLVAGSFVRAMARALVARGHGVSVACAARRAGDGFDAPIADDGVTVEAARYLFGETFYGAGAPDALGLGGGGGRWRARLGALDAVRALSFAAARVIEGSDAVVSHFALPCGAIAGALRGARRHVAVVHGTDGWLLARMPVAAQRALLRRASLVWYSHDALREAVAHPAEVPSAVRPMGWEPMHEAVSSASRRGPLRVAMVSRLVPVKRVDRAVEAVGALASKGVAVTLTVAGDGPLRSSLEALASRVAPGRVRWLGAVDARARDALLGASNVFLHTAGAIEGGRTEGAPVAVLEAMGAGLAVVACDAGGVRGLLGDAGLVTRAAATPKELADTLDSLTDEALRASLGERARGRAWPLRWASTAAWLEGALGLGS
ncbi:MAG: glycosyltransferase family 4 protein [Polyangiales bacterium]